MVGSKKYLTKHRLIPKDQTWFYITVSCPEDHQERWIKGVQRSPWIKKNPLYFFESKEDAITHCQNCPYFYTSRRKDGLLVKFYCPSHYFTGCDVLQFPNLQGNRDMIVPVSWFSMSMFVRVEEKGI